MIRRPEIALAVGMIAGLPWPWWPGAAAAEAEAGSSFADRTTQTDTGTQAARPNVSVVELERRARVLTDSLALANAEAAFFRNLYTELRLQNEALGVDALTGDERALQEKLVQAVKEAYQADKQRGEITAALEKVMAASQRLIKDAKALDPDRRAEYEVAVRSAAGVLQGRGGGPLGIGTSLQDGKIVDVNGQDSSVIINLGKTQEVREGMPFLVLRNDQPVGRVKVVQVRDYVSAAYIELEPNKPKPTLQVGDRVRVLANK